MSDLDLCISRREKIYNTVATNNIRLKGKNEKKQIFLKKLDGQRKINKNIEIVTMKIITSNAVLTLVLLT